MPGIDQSTVDLLLKPAEPPNRRLDVDAKHQRIAELLHDSGCEGLLILKPANFRWLTSGAAIHGLIGADEMPALYLGTAQRWLLSSNVDSQRIFDEEIDSLGFQLKEWPWYANRELFLAELCMGRRVACDLPFRECKYVGSFIDQERRRLTLFEQDRMQELGKALVHALEATARNISRGETEEEAAGHLAHRLLRHGVEPTEAIVAADGRGRNYRRVGSSSNPIRQNCVLQATGSKFGLFATASRTICFGEPDVLTRKEFDWAIRLSGVWLAVARADDRPQVALAAGRGLLHNGRFEHEWRLSPPGCWTGRENSEGLLTSTTTERFQSGHAVTWQARLGGAVACDTYLLRGETWHSATPNLEWPIRRIVVQGKTHDRPDLLVRVEA